MEAPIREKTISNFIEGYAETSTGEENLTKDLGEIFDYIERTCKWSLDDEYYVTECKHDFVFTDDRDNATDYGFKYCPYCGGKIEDVKDTK